MIRPHAPQRWRATGGGSSGRSHGPKKQLKQAKKSRDLRPTSNPAPATKFPFNFCDFSVGGRRLHSVSKTSIGRSLIEQSNRRIERRRTQVHVPLRRAEIAVASELLNRPTWSTPHCPMRIERVPQDMHASVGQVGASSCAEHQPLDDPLAESASVPLRQDSFAEMAVVAQGHRQSFREWNVAYSNRQQCPQPPSVKGRSSRRPRRPSQESCTNKCLSARALATSSANKTGAKPSLVLGGIVRAESRSAVGDPLGSCRLRNAPTGMNDQGRCPTHARHVSRVRSSRCYGLTRNKGPCKSGKLLVFKT